MSRGFAAVVCSLIAVWAVAAPTPARAYEDQASIDAEVSYAHAVSDTTSPHGVAVGVGASWGLSNVFTIRGQLAGALHPSAPRAGLFFASADLVYVVDVLELVPYFGVGLDAVGILPKGESLAPQFGVHPVVGLDWLVSRELALGLQVRPVFLLTALDSDPLHLRVGLTLSYLFEP